MRKKIYDAAIYSGIGLLLGLLAACSLSGPDGLSSNTHLSSLEISPGTLAPAFNSGTSFYRAALGDAIHSVTATAVKSSPAAGIEIQANGSGWQPIMSGSPFTVMNLDPGTNTIEIRVTAEDTVSTKIYTIEVYRLSDQALLDSLQVSTGTLTPSFDSQTVSYESDTDNAMSSTTVTAIVAQNGSTLQVQVNAGGWLSLDSGVPSISLSLIEGDNLLEVKVTAEDGVRSNLYTITVHRTSANADLSELALSSGTLDPAFDTAAFSYSATVASGIRFFKITARVADPTAAIHVRANGGAWQLCAPGIASSSLWLNTGENTVSVRVTAEDGLTRKLYTIVVRRQSGDANLASLQVNPGMLLPAFSVAATDYTSTVESSVATMTVTPAVDDVLSRIEVQINAGGWQALDSGDASPALELVPGTNTVEVKVTAEDPAVVKTYTILAARRYPGALDVQFAMPGGGMTVRSLELQGDGRVLVGGSSYNGRFWGHILRLNPDGTRDTSFANIEQGDWEGTSLGPIVAQADGKILIGGNFDAYAGTPRGGIARLNADGSLDASFLGTEPGTNGSLSSIVVQEDGKILIAGSFSTVNGVDRINLARLNPDGILDAAFLAGGEAPSGKVGVMALQSDGKILIGGSFSAYDGVSRGRIARLNSDGSLDTGFLAVEEGVSGGIFPWDPAIAEIEILDSGKILIGGIFTTVNGVNRKGFALLKADGSLDTSFPPLSGADNAVYAIAALADGRICIGGSFTAYNGVPRRCFARLNADGSLDETFLATGSGAAGTVYALLIQPDGRIVIGGGFSQYNDIPPGKVARVWPD